MAIAIKLTKQTLGTGEGSKGYAYTCTRRGVVLAQGWSAGTRDEAHHEAKNHLEQLGVINDGDES